ncbi:hypothetical protein GCM10011492_13970 [Flexivirga endophytica]|uniref:Uncharacterized protein n=1 Tax=Flexivirga endophytica TaxID=1849103 RepID=A0A916SZJ5_9MICO|nr:hypothetical protein GCM10011492_13970 [Flexivirga endophytica]GHB63881.1 hypothetical protein GCM10008112_36090 [Flexivirga endophytica]
MRVWRIGLCRGSEITDHRCGFDDIEPDPDRLRHFELVDRGQREQRIGHVVGHTDLGVEAGGYGAACSQEVEDEATGEAVDPSVGR